MNRAEGEKEAEALPHLSIGEEAGCWLGVVQGCQNRHMHISVRVVHMTWHRGSSGGLMLL